jgi:hypothetical protein
MKTVLELTSFQSLNLEVGERASCEAGFPRKSLVVVECIKDFDTAINNDYLVNNHGEFVKVVHYGIIGISTSHLISYNWVAEDVRFNK